MAVIERILTQSLARVCRRGIFLLLCKNLWRRWQQVILDRKEEYYELVFRLMSLNGLVKEAILKREPIWVVFPLNRYERLWSMLLLVREYLMKSFGYKEEL